MKLRYQFRLYPSVPQKAELAKAFGCARIVYNDALRLRQHAYQRGKSEDVLTPEAAEPFNRLPDEA